MTFGLKQDVKSGSYESPLYLSLRPSRNRVEYVQVFKVSKTGNNRVRLSLPQRDRYGVGSDETSAGKRTG